MKTEREKMVAGELYDPMHADLRAARSRAREICRALNASPESAVDERLRLTTSLFAAGGDTVELQSPFFCDYGDNITLGARVFFNFNCVLLDVCPIHIGDDSLIGPGVQIVTAMHPLNAVLRRSQENGRPVRIGHDVWIGAGAIICPGVQVGDGAVIGAGSVVTRDVPAGVLAVGNPCRVLRAITE